MSNSVSSPQQGGAAQGGVSLTNELTARLQAHARGLSSQSSGQPSFAQIMTQQELNLQRSAEPKAPEKKPERQPATQDAAAKAQANARLNEQMLARARQRNEVEHQGEALAPDMAAPSKPVSAAPVAAEAAPSATAEGVAEPHTNQSQVVPEQNVAEEAAADEPVMKQGAKEAVADGANMMAWLMNAPLERSTDLPTATQVLQAEDSEAQANSESDQQALLADLAIESDLNQHAADVDAGGGVPLDSAQWQQTAALVALKGGQTSAKALGAEMGMAPVADVSAMVGLSAAQAPKGQGGTFAPLVRHESATLPTPIQHPDFSKAFNEQVRMWVNTTRTDGTMTAELHLNPAETGPIQVKIAIDGQVAKIDFAAAAAETRRAIEASMAQLSAALNESGLNFAGGDVSAQTSQQSFGQASRGAGEGQSGLAQSGAEVDSGQEVSAASLQSLRAAAAAKAGGLDLYA